MKRQKQHSKFIRYCLCAVSVLLMFCVIFVFYLFRTNLMFDYEKYNNVRSDGLQRITVSTIISQAESDETTETPSDTNPTPAPPGTVVPPTGTVLQVGEVEKYIYHFLKDMGYADEAIAGIMGNILRESGMKTSAVNESAGGKHHTPENLDDCVSVCYNTKNDAHGLCQWLGGRKRGLFDTAIAMNKAWYDIEVQTSFIQLEIGGSYGVCNPSNILQGAQGCDPVEYATYMWADRYEGCEGSAQCTDFSTRNYLVNFQILYGYATDYYATIKAGGFN